MKEIESRRLYTRSRIDDLRFELGSEVDRHIVGRACVYATGSFGRREASKHSDLDLFIVGKNAETKDNKKESMLSLLSEICIKAELIKATGKLNIRDFDGDGRYLVHHPAYLLISTLGKPEDDLFNTFTSRLLLLLESSVLIEGSIYSQVISDVIAAYWGDYPGHRDNFMPAFLANDILRLWRTFCVNYEVRTERKPDHKKWKRKTKNYKLKFSRLLTCYSALLYLLDVFKNNGTVTPDDALAMVTLSPTARIEEIRSKANSKITGKCLDVLLDKYDNFLKVTDVPESDLIEQFSDDKTSARHFKEAKEFGTSMFEALSLIGGKSEFYRLLVV
jgi:predicted nucleotidyltransferase